MPGDQLSRRRALVLGLSTALVASAGCSSPSAADPDPSDRLSVDPDVAIREAAAQAERGLLATYTATVTRHPDLAARLAAPAAHHAEHLAALSGATAAPEATSTTSSTAPATPTATPTPGDTGAAVADDPLAAIAALAVAEREAAASRLDEVEGTSPALARLVASVGAAEAAHAALLGS